MLIWSLFWFSIVAYSTEVFLEFLCQFENYKLDKSRFKKYSLIYLIPS